MIAKRAFVVLAALCSATCLAHEWTDAGTSQAIEGDVVDCKVTIKLANGHKKVIDLKSLSEDDQQAVLNEIRAAGGNHAQKGKPASKPIAAAAANKPNVKVDLQSLQNQQHTDFGAIKLTEQQINSFITERKASKARIMQSLQNQLGYRAPKLSADETKKYKAIMSFLSQDNVIIPDRTDGAPGSIFKPTPSDEDQYLVDTGKISTLKIIDKQSAYVTIDNIANNVILEGIDTTKLPTGEWKSRLLLRDGGKKKIPGAFGDVEVQFYQAVSDEGFPKDIVIW